jgi:hypothetical protein
VVTHRLKMRIILTMNKLEKALDNAALAVKKTRNVDVFIKFLKAFKEAEEEHIRNALNPKDSKDFNLRQANLCAEAYAAADLMHQMITKKD